MYAINSQCQWWVSIATWSQPTSYQRWAKQGCLTTSYDRSTRRWLVAFSMTPRHRVAARSESIQLCLQQKIVLLSESTLPKMAILQRWMYGICALTCHLSHLDRLMPRRLCTHTLTLTQTYAAWVRVKGRKHNNLIRNLLEYLPTQTLNYAIITGPTVFDLWSLDLT